MLDLPPGRLAPHPKLILTGFRPRNSYLERSSVRLSGKSPGLLGYFDRDLEMGSGCRRLSGVAPISPRDHKHNLGREAAEPELVTPVGNSEDENSKR